MVLIFQVKMVLLSFYLVDPRPGRAWRRFYISSVDHYPTDWLELKMLLRECMEVVYVDHGMTEAYISLERHLPGRFTIRKTVRYGQEKIPFKREDEGLFRIEYDPRNGEITVKEANFGFHLGRLREEFRAMERGKEYEIPPLIPREHQNLGDPKSLLLEPSATRYADYSRKQTPLYDVLNEYHGSSYRRSSRLTYARRKRRQLSSGEEEFR